MKTKQIFEKIWEKTKLSNPDALFIKKGSVELLFKREGYLCVKCRAKDVQKNGGC